MTHIVTVTRPDAAAPAVLKVYADGVLVVEVPLSKVEAIHLARQALGAAA